jgi:hypothetical protein
LQARGNEFETGGAGISVTKFANGEKPAAGVRREKIAVKKSNVGALFSSKQGVLSTPRIKTGGAGAPTAPLLPAGLRPWTSCSYDRTAYFPADH